MDLGAHRQTGPTQITAVPVEVPPTFFAALGGTSVTGPQVSVHLISLAPRFYPGHPGYVPAAPTHLDAEVRAVSVSSLLIDPGTCAFSAGPHMLLASLRCSHTRTQGGAYGCAAALCALLASMRSSPAWTDGRWVRSWLVKHENMHQGAQTV